MKIIRYENADVGSINTIMAENVGHGDTEFLVDNATGFDINDFILMEEVGHEKNEIVRITNIDENNLFTTPINMPHEKNVKITKLNYDKFKITKQTTSDTKEKDVVKAKFDYAHEHNLIEYVDMSDDANDSLIYNVYYVNSYTDTEDKQVSLQNEFNYGYISVDKFREETSFQKDEATDMEIESAIYTAFQWIKDNIYFIQEYDNIDTNSDIFIRVPTRLEFADYNGDRVIDKRDIIVYEYNPSTYTRIYHASKIINIDTRSKIIRFSEKLPLNSQNQLVVKVPLTFKKYEDINSILSNISKLKATNVLLRDIGTSKIKGGVTSWSAGGTNVNRDINNISGSIEFNDKQAKELSNSINKFYSARTKLRTRRSSLDDRRFHTFNHGYGYRRR